ncbi:MAG TPA: DUF3311 domain-containing protein [Candidatus Dormibacteraeota bacterium]|nr:DUF3311 domain-containing protein [Candidatus Dormibacteraeota bacterium]
MTTRIILAIIPALALTFAIPFVDSVEPRILGLPFLVAWIVAWILLTPIFMWNVYRLEQKS